MYKREEKILAGSIAKWSLLGLAILILLFAIFGSFYSIKSTERGVISTFGKINPTPVKDGLHFKMPFAQKVHKVNIQQKKFDGVENSYTRDVQTSSVTYTINYDLVTENVSKLIMKVGDDYHTRIVVPFIRSAMKKAFGNYDATEIVKNRDKVRSEIEESLRKTLNNEYFTNIQFQIVDIDYDDDFERAIKEKQVAEQNALKARNVTIQIEEQAKQMVIKAEAEAEAMRIKATALERNQKLVEYEAVQKWDGKLPQYTGGGAIPFINIK